MLEDQAGKADANQSDSTTDSLALDSITQAIKVMGLFEKGASDIELIDYLQKETSLAQAYFLFFKQMGWIECQGPPYWRLTKKGKETLILFTTDDGSAKSL